MILRKAGFGFSLLELPNPNSKFYEKQNSFLIILNKSTIKESGLKTKFLKIGEIKLFSNITFTCFVKMGINPRPHQPIYFHLITGKLF